MRSLLKFVLPLSLVLGLSAVASAHDTDDTLAPDTQFDFIDGSDVLGETEGPAGARIFHRLPSRRVTLVRPRTHFVPELMKSIERI
jgi:hypothetical protein